MVPLFLIDVRLNIFINLIVRESRPFGLVCHLINHHLFSSILTYEGKTPDDFDDTDKILIFLLLDHINVGLNILITQKLI